jgi:hypothetical protein
MVSAARNAPALAVTLTRRNAGDAFLVFATFGGGANTRDGFFSITDTSGTSFDQLASQSSVISHGDTEIGDVYIGLPGAATSDTVTATEPGGTGSGVLEVVEITGQSAAIPVDAVASATGGAANISGGMNVSVNTRSTLTSLSDLVFAVSAFYGNGGITRQSFSPAGTGEVNEQTISIAGLNPMSLAFSVQDPAALASQSFGAQLAGSVAANSEFILAISPSS